MGVRQRAWRTASAAFVVVGAVALFWSAQQDRIWWVLAGFLVGMTSLSLLLLRVGDAIEDWLVDHQPPWVPWAFGAVAAGGLGGVVIVIVRQWPPAAAIAAVIVMTVGVIGLFQWSDRSPLVAGVGASPTPGGPEPPARIGIGSATWYGFEAMAAAIGLYLISDGTTTLIGAVLWLSGLVTVKIASIRWLEIAR